jgi:hypothetical protein
MSKDSRAPDPCLPKIFALLPGIKDFFACQSLLEFGGRGTNFSKYIFVMLRLYYSQGFAHKMLVNVVDNAGNWLLRQCRWFIAAYVFIPSPISGIIVAFLNFG